MSAFPSGGRLKGRVETGLWGKMSRDTFSAAWSQNSESGRGNAVRSIKIIAAQIRCNNTLARTASTCRSKDSTANPLATSHAARWYFRQFQRGVLSARIVPLILGLIPSILQIEIVHAYFAFRQGNRGIDATTQGILNALSPTARSEVALITAMRFPTIETLRGLTDLPATSAHQILMTFKGASLPDDVLCKLVVACCAGSNLEKAEAIDRSLQLAVDQYQFTPLLSRALFTARQYVDAAALATAWQGMGGDMSAVADIYIKGCITLGEHDSARRFCGNDIAKQRICLDSILDNGTTVVACQYLRDCGKPEEVLTRNNAARIIQQLASLTKSPRDNTFFELEVHWLMGLLMEVQEQREVDVAVASALGACGEWETCLSFFHLCTTLPEAELLLTSAARGGAPFDKVQPYVVEIVRQHPKLDANRFREILIRCALEAGEVQEALSLFRIATRYGTSTQILDHPSLLGEKGCPEVLFSCKTYLQAGMVDLGRAGIGGPDDRSAWENFVVEAALEEYVFELSVGPAVRLLVRLCDRSRWRAVLEQYFPSVPLAATTRQWVSHFIAGRLCSAVGVEDARRFLKVHSALSDEESTMLLHLVAPSQCTVGLLIEASWEWGLMCFRHPVASAVPSSFDALSVAEGILRARFENGRMLVKVSINLTQMSRGGRRRPPLVIYVDVGIASPVDTACGDGVDHIGELPTSCVCPLSEICRHLGSIKAAEVVERWASLITQGQMSTTSVGVWLEACIRAKNQQSAIEILRLSAVTKITPPRDVLLSMIQSFDWDGIHGHTLIDLVKLFPSSYVALAEVAKVHLGVHKRATHFIPWLAMVGGVQTPEHIWKYCSGDLEYAQPTTHPICIPLDLEGLGRLCQLPKEHEFSVQCDFYIHSSSGKSQVEWVRSGSTKTSYRSDEEAARYALMSVCNRGDFPLWRVVANSLVLLAGARVCTPSACEKGLIFLSLSDITPSEMLQVLEELEGLIAFSSLARVFLSCYYASRDMQHEAQRHAGMAPGSPKVAEAYGYCRHESNLCRLATVMAMLPSARLCALAWVKLDAIAIDCIFASPHQLPRRLACLLQQSPRGNEREFRWLLSPRACLSDVGAASGHSSEAELALSSFSKTAEANDRRVRVGKGNPRSI